MTTTTDLALLRRAVLLDPGSDDARLVFADEIEESGGEQEQRWAELIRCQIRLARPPWNSKDMLRAEALLRDLTPWLRRGEMCTSCGGRRIVRQAVLKPFKFTIEPPRIEPSASLFDTVEVECPTCHGTGWLGSLIVASVNRQLPEYDLIIPATFSRGFVSRVELTADQVQDTEFMRRLFSEWPVTEAGLIGKEPYWNGAGHAWYDPNRTRPNELVPRSAEVPSLLIERMDYPNHRWAAKPTAADAIAALSRAIVSLGREAAGLPQIGEVRK